MKATTNSEEVNSLESSIEDSASEASLDNVHEEKVLAEGESVQAGVINSAEGPETKSGWMGGIVNGLNTWKANFGKKSALSTDL